MTEVMRDPGAGVGRWSLGPAILVATAALLFGGAPAAAQTPLCEALTGEQRALANKLLGSQYAHDCCDETLAACLEKRPRCALVERLADDICRRIAAGQDEQKIVRGLSRRARSMMAGGRPAESDLRAAPVVGSADAPVQLVIYACARCPFCAKIIPQLHRAVTAGPLKGKIKMAMKTFPIRSHEHAKDAGLAFVAAARLGHFWEFLLYAYGHMDTFCPKKQVDWATAVGMDGAQFAQLLKDAETRNLLVESKKEGLRNKVEATPTLFIDGRRYTGDLEIDELIDVLEEAADKAQGRRFVAQEAPAGGGAK